MSPVTFVGLSAGSTCLVASTNAYCFGANGYFQAGLYDSATDSLPTVSASAVPVCFSNTTAGTCGANQGGGLPVAAVYSIGNSEDKLAGISSANIPSTHCAVTEGGKAICWGGSEKFKLGLGTPTPKPANDRIKPLNLAPLALSLQFGDAVLQLVGSTYTFQTCARTALGRVYCWGYYQQPQSASIFAASSIAPASFFQETTTRVVGDQKNELAFLSPLVFNTTDACKSLTAGKNHICAIFDVAANVSTSAVRCWGGDTDGAASGTPSSTTVSVLTALKFLTFGTTDRAETISAGTSHTCATFSNSGDNIRCWGKQANAGYGTAYTLISQVPFLTVAGFRASQVRTHTAGACALFSTAFSGLLSVRCWGNLVPGAFAPVYGRNAAELLAIVGASTKLTPAQAPALQIGKPAYWSAARPAGGPLAGGFSIEVPHRPYLIKNYASVTATLSDSGGAGSPTVPLTVAAYASVTMIRVTTPTNIAFTASPSLLSVTLVMNVDGVSFSVPNLTFYSDPNVTAVFPPYVSSKGKTVVTLTLSAIAYDFMSVFANSTKCCFGSSMASVVVPWNPTSRTLSCAAPANLTIGAGIPVKVAPNGVSCSTSGSAIVTVFDNDKVALVGGKVSPLALPQAGTGGVALATAEIDASGGRGAPSELFSMTASDQAKLLKVAYYCLNGPSVANRSALEVSTPVFTTVTTSSSSAPPLKGGTLTWAVASKSAYSGVIFESTATTNCLAIVSVDGGANWFPSVPAASSRNTPTPTSISSYSNNSVVFYPAVVIQRLNRTSAAFGVAQSSSPVEIRALMLVSGATTLVRLVRVSDGCVTMISGPASVSNNGMAVNALFPSDPCPASPGQAGVVTVSLSQDGGLSWSANVTAGTFYYLRLLSVTPGSAPTSASAILYVTGEGFPLMTSSSSSSSSSSSLSLQAPTGHVRYYNSSGGVAREIDVTMTGADAASIRSPTDLAAGYYNLSVSFFSDRGVFSEFTPASPLVSFYVFPAPTVTAIVPAIVPAGIPTVISVYGLNFPGAEIAEEPKVTLASQFPVWSCAYSTTILNMFSCSTTVPSTLTGILSVDVLYNGVSQTALVAGAVKLSLVAFAAVSVFPALVPVPGSGKLVVSGDGFFLAPGVAGFECVWPVASAAPTPAQVLGSTSLSCAVSPALTTVGVSSVAIRPVAAAGSPSGGLAPCLPVPVTLIVAPTVVAVSPTFGAASARTTVTVFGSNFFSPPAGYAVSCLMGSDQALATSTAGLTKGWVVCEVAPGSGVIAVELSFNGVDYSRSGVIFTYYSITSLSPPTGPFEGGGMIKVLGVGFIPVNPDSDILCALGGVRLPATRNSATSVTCGPIPAVSPGPGTNSSSSNSTTSTSTTSTGAASVALLTLSMSNGTANESASYAFYRSPVVSAAAPLGGPLSGGTVVTLYGSGLSSATGLDADLRCQFGFRPSVSAAVTIVTDKVIRCVSERGSGTVALLVSRNGGKDYTASTGAPVFTYFTVFSVQPTLGPSTGGTAISVLGTGFALSAGVSYACVIGGVSVPARVVSESLLSCVSPPHAATIVRRKGMRMIESLQANATGVAATLLPVLVSGDSGNTTIALADTPPAAAFGFHSPVTLFAVTPPSGPRAGGVRITISGIGFPAGQPAGSLLVRLGPASVTNAPLVANLTSTASGSAVLADVGALAEGPYDVFVSVNAGADWVALAGGYTAAQCPAGTYSTFFTEPCQPCAPGYYNPQPGQKACTPCPRSNYTRSAGAQACDACPANTAVPDSDPTPGAGVEACLCLKGYYEPSLSPGRPCSACPEGGLCQGLTVAPVPTAGYWSSTSDPYTFLPCVGVGSAGCVGGAPGYCKPPYTAQLCGGCVKGSYMSSGVCRACPSKAVSGVLLGTFVALCVLLTAFTLRITRDTSIGRAGGSLGIIVFNFQVLSLVADADVGWDSRIVAVLRVIRAPFTLSLDSFGLECLLSGFGYQSRWLASVLIPFYFAVLFGVVFLVALARSSLCGAKISMPAVRAQLINSGYLVYSLTYLFMAEVTLKHFDCTHKSNGMFVLDAAPSLVCFQGWWYKMLGIAVAGVTLYSVLIPVAVLILLHRSRRRFRDPEFSRKYGSIYGNYSSTLPLWEGVVLVEKLLLCSSALFLSSFTQFQLAIVLSLLLGFLILHFSNSPYWLARDNHLSSALRWSMIVVLSIGVVVKAGQFPTSSFAVVLLALFFVCLGVILSAVVFIVLSDIFALRGAVKTELQKDIVAILRTNVSYPHGKALVVRWLESGAATVFEQRNILRMFRKAAACLNDPELYGLGDGSSGLGGGGGGSSEEDTTPRSSRGLLGAGSADRDAVIVAATDVATHRILAPAAVAVLARWLDRVGLPALRAGAEAGGEDALDASAIIFSSVSYARFHARHSAANRSFIAWFAAGVGFTDKGAVEAVVPADPENIIRKAAAADDQVAAPAPLVRPLTYTLVRFLYRYSHKTAEEISNTLQALDPRAVADLPSMHLVNTMQLFLNMTTPDPEDAQAFLHSVCAPFSTKKDVVDKLTQVRAMVELKQDEGDKEEGKHKVGGGSVEIEMQAIRKASIADEEQPPIVPALIGANAVAASEVSVEVLTQPTPTDTSTTEDD